jgi:hypothetical protein
MIYSKNNLSGQEYIEVVTDYYAIRDEWFNLSPRVRHVLLCSCLAGRRKNLIFTAESACAINYIARTDEYDLLPHCISAANRSNDVICWHYGQADPQATFVNGLLIASPLRIICDLALSDTPESVLVSLNHCLCNGLFTHKQFDEMLEQHVGKKGQKLLKRLSFFATEKCESALETIAFIAIYKAGFVMPEQQKRIKIDPQYTARTDMCWEFKGNKIILELDGKMKNPTGDWDIMNKQNERQKSLEKLGYKVIRMLWKDVRSGNIVTLLTECGIPKRRNFGRIFPD